MDDKLTISLGGEKFTVEALTLGDIERLDIARAVEDGIGTQAATKAHYQRCIGIISTALVASGRTDMTPDMLRKLRITAKQMTESAIAILKFSELIPQEPKAGEPVAAVASSGVVQKPGAKAA
jgi:hypothetical protein